MIRLTGGKFRGQYLKTVEGLGTRPSNAKVRQAIFNIIREDLTESNWLDLFGGTGAVGFEALSRGAKKVTFIEKDFKAFSCLKNNTEKLELVDQVNLRKQDALVFLEKVDELFDYIYIDPPYQSDLYQKVFSLLAKKNFLLQEFGRLIVESATKNPPPVLNFAENKSYQYGDTTLTIYRNKWLKYSVHLL